MSQQAITQRASPRGSDPAGGLTQLVDAACGGDRVAWQRLVERFDAIVRSTARSYRLQPADVDDVVQATWLALLCNIDGLREPQSVGGWLVTTTRRAAMHALQRRAREHLTDDAAVFDRSDPDTLDDALLSAERDTTLAEAVSTLSGQQGRIVTALLRHPDLAYREIGELLDVPVGSIGPGRSRSLSQLSRHPRLRALHDARASA